MIASNTKFEEILEFSSVIKQKYTDSIQQFTERETFLTDPSTKLIVPAGTDVSPDSKANIFWNSASKEIVITQEGMPTPSLEMRYQLWG